MEEKRNILPFNLGGQALTPKEYGEHLESEQKMIDKMIEEEVEKQKDGCGAGAVIDPDLIA